MILNISILCIVTLIFVTQTAHSLPRHKRALSQIYVKPWTNATIPYFINPAFSDADIFYVKRAMGLYSNETCLRFESYKPDTHPNWLKIEDAEICHSEIGMQSSGQQALSLAKSCRNYGLILHELAHTIGLMHEMMRPDRNQFIHVFKENIQDNAIDGFTIESQHYKLLNTPFDFQSITMYSPYDFSKNGLPVWTKLNSSDPNPIYDSREKDISFWDIRAINEMYQCANHCSTVRCPYPSFLNKDCQCQSPEDFADRRCLDDPNYQSICKNASQTDVCYNKPIVASEICRKTCGRCFRYGKHGNASAPPPICTDYEPDRCSRNKLDGYCITDVWTKVNCKNSCKTCSTHSDPSVIEFRCKDRHNSDLCEDWASKGQCDANPGFMKSSCAKSCGTCQSSDTVTKPLIPCRNYSPDSYCDTIARQNKCDGTTLTVCLGSCGKCGSNYERNEPNISESEIDRLHRNTIRKECKDILSECEYFSKAGYCGSHKESMKYHCNKSCNFCDDAECTNIDSDHVCDDVKERGLCRLHAGFASRCRKTCNQCPLAKSTVPSKPSCVDLESKYICDEIVRRQQCQIDRSRTRSCIRTCGLCHTITKARVTSSVTGTSRRCVDEDSEETCTKLLTNGWCQSYLDRAVLCRRTCNLCDNVLATTTSCRNEANSATCNSWASAGYCRDNREYMAKNCALACKLCAVTEDLTQPCADADELSVCSVYVKDNQCKTNTEYMSERCRKSCSFCGMKVTASSIRRTMASTLPMTTKTTICTNIESNDTCQAWSERGFCNDYADYMRVNCAFACNICAHVPSLSHTTSAKLTMSATKERCVNSQPESTCNSWKQGGYCSQDYIADMCKKSCDRCP